MTPTPLRALGRTAWGRTAHHLSTYTRTLVPTYAEEHVQPGEHLVLAMRVRGMSLALVDAAIRLERAAGTDWATLAAIRHQDPADLAAAYPETSDPQDLADTLLDVIGGDPAEVTAWLDAWYERTGGDRYDTDRPRPPITPDPCVRP